VAQLALENLRTDATKTIMEKAKAKGDTVVHPYLEVIDRSLNFSNYEFWFNTPTSIDLKRPGIHRRHPDSWHRSSRRRR
jgi:hypothetical protein